MRRIATFLLTAFTLVCLETGCGEKQPPKGGAERPAESAEEEAPARPAEKPVGETEPVPDVGVSDFIDYAIGKTPIRHGNRMKRRIRDINAERNKQLEEAMGE